MFATTKLIPARKVHPGGTLVATRSPETDADDPDRFVGYTLVRAGHALERRFEEALAEVPLSARQFGVLAHLARQPGLGSGQLARLVLVTPQSMGDLVDSLETAGYVIRDEPRGRGHKIGVRLTDDGRQALARAAAIVSRFEAATLAGLDDQETAMLNAMLHRILRAVDSATRASRTDQE